MQQNIRYQLGGSAYVFQDFEDGERIENFTQEEEEITPKVHSKNENTFTSAMKEQQHTKQLEIINDAEEDEDKESLL